MLISCRHYVFEELLARLTVLEFWLLIYKKCVRTHKRAVVKMYLINCKMVCIVTNFLCWLALKLTGSGRDENDK